MFAKKKILNQQTDYRNKNLKYRSTNDVNYHVSLSCDNLNLLVLSLMLVVKASVPDFEILSVLKRHIWSKLEMTMILLRQNFDLTMVS